MGEIRRFEAVDGNCVSCHLHESFHGRANAKSGAGADLASFHARLETRVRCIDCHVGERGTDRAAVLGLAAYDTFKYALGFGRESEGSRLRIADRTCRKCHLDLTRGRGFFHKNATHWELPFDCVECHRGHATTDPEAFYTPLERDDRQCVVCHEVDLMKLELGNGAPH